LMFAHRFEKAGTYYVRVTDYQHSGSPRHFYRIVAGEFPLVDSTWPLGVRKSTTAELGVRGSHLASKIKVTGSSSEDTLSIRPQHAFNEVRVAVGEEPEVESQGGAVTLPVTINGHIAAAGSENRYRFQARKGEQYFAVTGLDASDALGTGRGDKDHRTICGACRSGRLFLGLADGQCLHSAARPRTCARDHDFGGRADSPA